MRGNLIQRSIGEHLSALAAGEYSAVELLDAYLQRIDACEGEIGAFLTINRESALQAARESDRRRAMGEPLGALEGIPFGLKDNFCTRGERTTCASGMLEHFVPPFDAAVVERLREAGGILVGKLNMDEFAMGSSTETSALGVTKNPIDPARVPGGSSGGSAAAVAAHEVPFSLGSDTGGSVRQPASFCGTVGLKPTYGAISRHGMIAMASSLDCVGILTNTVSEAARVFAVLAGKDVRDATSVRSNFLFPMPPVKLSSLRVGVVRSLMEGDLVFPEVREATERAIAYLQTNGAEIVEVSLPSADAALAAYCVISAAEASSNLARYGGVTYGTRGVRDGNLTALYESSRGKGFGHEVKRRLLFGGYVLSEEKRALYYDRACRAREEIRREMGRLLTSCDLFLTPTSPTTAFLRGARLTVAEQRRADLCAVYSSLAGLPAVSVPFGRDRNGLPIGIQLAAAPFAESLLLAAAQRLEEVAP